MEELFKIYSDTNVRGRKEEKLFSDFFSKDSNRKNVEACLDAILGSEICKNDGVADRLRAMGNALYNSHKYHESVAKYTEALCRAMIDGNSYGLILANRSAAFFKLCHYNDSLIDIDNCMYVNIPDATKLKLYVRKVKCLYHTGCDYKNVVGEARERLDSRNKVTFDEEISTLHKHPPHGIASTHNDEIPQLTDGPNETFSYASLAVRLQYNEHSGRHVTSNSKKITKGDVLFVEKPFVFAPVFPNEDLYFGRCYNCLGSVSASIPCAHCTKCVFCDENCRTTSWNEFHKWECRGMRSNLWYHIGIAFPAMRALLRGLEKRSEHYKRFNGLVTNIWKMPNVLPLVISAATVVMYLQKYTAFFEGRSDVMNIGALLVRHIAQLQCNASVVTHAGESVACAIYPSVSMMNHSCKPNISISYINDVVVVRAAKDIQAGEEVFNCYGIDCRYLDRASRQEQCSSLYYFKCECRACK